MDIRYISVDQFGRTSLAKMAESNVIEVKSDSEEQNSKLDMSTVGNTLTEGSSDELHAEGEAKKVKRKKRWVPKLIVEKRSRSSSESSDKENFSNVTESNDPHTRIRLLCRY